MAHIINVTNVPLFLRLVYLTKVPDIFEKHKCHVLPANSLQGKDTY